MTFDVLFNTLCTSYRFQKTLKNNRLIDRKRELGQLKNELTNNFTLE